MCRDNFSTHTTVKYMYKYIWTKRTVIDRQEVDGITVHFIGGRVSWPSERPSVKVFEAQQPAPKRTEGKSSKGCSGTTPAAEEKTLPAFPRSQGATPHFLIFNRPLLSPCFVSWRSFICIPAGERSSPSCAIVTYIPRVEMQLISGIVPITLRIYVYVIA